MVDTGNSERPFAIGVPVYEQVLNPIRLHELSEKASVFSANGSTSLIYNSGSRLTPDECARLSRIKGRMVSDEVLIKEAKSLEKVGILSNNDAIRNDAEVANIPGIEPFVVATSNTRIDGSGYVSMLVEKATGLSLRDKEAVANLTAEDIARINYQLLVVCEEMCLRDDSPSDIGKDVFYRPSEKPPRILLYDVSYARKLPFKGAERAKYLIGEVRRMADTWRHFILKYVPLNLGRETEQLIHKMEEVKYQTFGQLAQEIDTGYGGKFSMEYREITGGLPSSIHLFKMTSQDAETAVLENKREIQEKEEERIRNKPFDDVFKDLVSYKRWTGDDSPLLPGDRHLASELMEVYFIKGLVIEGRTREDIRSIELNDRYHPGHPANAFLNCRTKDGRLVIDYILDELEEKGLVTSEKPKEALLGLQDQKPQTGEQIAETQDQKPAAERPVELVVDPLEKAFESLGNEDFWMSFWTSDDSPMSPNLRLNKEYVGKKVQKMVVLANMMYRFIKDGMSKGEIISNILKIDSGNFPFILFQKIKGEQEMIDWFYDRLEKEGVHVKE